MKRIALTLAALSLSFSATACGGNDPAEQAVTLMEEMGGIMNANAEDCDKMGDELGAFMSKNEAKLNKLKESMKTVDEEAMMKKYGARVGKVMEAMMTNGLKCAENEKVQSALGALQ